MERQLIEYVGPVADALEVGIVPWERPRLPVNVLTGRAYRGLNPLLLNIAARRHGFASPLWGSRKDWETVGSKLTEPVTAGTRVWIYEDLVYYPWDRTDDDVAYNWEQTDRSVQPPALKLGDAAEVLGKIVGGTGVGEMGPGGVADTRAVAHDVMRWAESRMPTEGGYLYHTPGLLKALRASIGANYFLAALGVGAVPVVESHQTTDPRWAGLLRQRPEVLPGLCKLATDALDLLLGFAGVKLPWHFFKVKVTRWCLPRGACRPSVYSVRADDKILGDVWREAGRRWKAGEWSGKHARSRTLGNYNVKEAALAALLAHHGLDERTPVIDDANVVSVPVSFGPWAGKRTFDFDSAHYLGDGEDGCFFLVEQGPEGKWHAVVIVSTDWENSVLAIEGPHDDYVDACEAGLRAALGWLMPRQIRVADEEIRAIRDAARSI